jgi:alkyl hydroperoxide reductase subunit AhpF
MMMMAMMAMNARAKETEDMRKRWTERKLNSQKPERLCASANGRRASRVWLVAGVVAQWCSIRESGGVRWRNLILPGQVLRNRNNNRAELGKG